MTGLSVLECGSIFWQPQRDPIRLDRPSEETAPMPDKGQESQLSETWLSAEISNEAIEPAGFSVQCQDRTKDLSGKGKEVGVCFMINNAWCDQWNVRFIESFCSPHLEYLIISCIVMWLPREISGVYIPPQYDTDLVLGKLFEAVNSPEATTIAVGDFNKAKFRHLAPKIFQHISCSTRKSSTPDH
ncbi:hypothetical protein MHYP_G00308550 [Metynnis hypsauchen]